MKQRIYIRIAKTVRGYKVSAATKPNPAAIQDVGYRWRRKIFPTVQFPVDVEVPDEMFELSKEKLVQTLKVTQQNGEINYEIPALTSLAKSKKGTV